MDLAAANYLEFLKEGRKAILEDAAILQDKYPKHRIFNLPCFKLPQDDSARTALQKKWAEYKAEVIAAHVRSVDENIEVSLYTCNCLLHTCLFLSMLPCLRVCTRSSCNILSIQSMLRTDNLQIYRLKTCGTPLMHLSDQLLLSIVIKPLGLPASTSIAMQVEENNLCMVTKNALLQQQNQHLQEKLETQRQQQLHQQQQLLISQQEASHAALCMMSCGTAGYLALLYSSFFLHVHM